MVKKSKQMIPTLNMTGVILILLNVLCLQCQYMFVCYEKRLIIILLSNNSLINKQTCNSTEALLLQAYNESVIFLIIMIRVWSVTSNDFDIIVSSFLFQGGIQYWIKDTIINLAVRGRIARVL